MHLKLQRGSLVFALVFCWKLALFVFTAQPVPSNDSFFYDGAVANYLINGNYYNPSLATALPISGTRVFSAYPPLYQLPLLAWGSVFGVSARSIMGLHLVLFGLYMLVLLAILRRLDVPDWCVQFAGAFLLLNTFHDRPDTLAQLLGMTAVYAWIRSRRVFGRGETVALLSSTWTWLMAVLVVLTIFTSLQIGGTYLVLIWIGVAASCLAGNERFPVAPMAATLAGPILLVAAISSFLPLAWQGFLEHAHQTPTVTGLRFPAFDELLKTGRVDSGVLIAAVCLPWAWFKQRRDYDSSNGLRQEVVLIAALVASVAIMVPSLFLLAANDVAIPGYFQPLIVAAYLSVSSALFAGTPWFRTQTILLAVAVVVGSLRAVGMSTWGVACSWDVSYSRATQCVRQELDRQPPGSTVVLSSAYLYEAARHKNVRWLHSDWLTQFTGLPDSDLQGLIRWRPTELILTQFDYFRRFEGVIAELKSDGRIERIRIENLAHVPAPESFPRLRRVIQHISWAPVVIHLDWKEAPSGGSKNFALRDLLPLLSCVASDSNMEIIPLGVSSLLSSRLGYGCWRLAGTWNPAEVTPENEARGRQAVIAAYESGYTLFDNADIYCHGVTESIFGSALKQVAGMRERVIVATKCGIRFAGDPDPQAPARYDFSASHILRSCEGSLKRMGIETIDLYQLHRPDFLANPNEIAEAFTKLKQSGKVRYFGVSNFRPTLVTALQVACPMPLVVHQVEISLAKLDCFTDGTLDQCLIESLTPLAWSPLAQGLLSTGQSSFAEKPGKSTVADRVGLVLDDIAKVRGASRATVALAWLLKHPAKIVPIIGSTNPERIREAVQASELDLSREEWYRLYIAARGERLP